MKTIAFWNRKGGTGKTTTAGNVAADLRNYGRTLLVDCDPQSNLTSWLVTKGAEHELVDVLTSTVGLPLAVVNVRAALDVLPSFAIGGELKTWAETKLPGQPFAFADLREAIHAVGYQYAVFDMAPGDSTLERAALAVADEVGLVAAPEYFSADGLEAAADTLQAVLRDRRAHFQASCLVVNRVNRSYAAHEVFTEAFGASGYRLYTIGQSTGIHDALMLHKTIWDHDPGNRWITEYKRLTKELQ